MLCAPGHDAVSAHELDPIRLEDAEHLARATGQDRAILTYNYRHFLRIGTAWFETGRSHAGIVIAYHQYARNELGILRQAVLRLLDTLSAETLRDATAVLDEFRPGAPT